MASDPASDLRTTSSPAGRWRGQGRVASIRFVRSFVFAWAGLVHLFRTQRNARVHAAVAALACGVAWWLGIGRVEWAVLVLTIAGVLVLEGLNTALEAVVNLASPRYHPLAKVAKDVAAGMVLIAAIAAVAVGLLILGPPLWQRVMQP
jgi:diacylglycerol kinase